MTEVPACIKGAVLLVDVYGYWPSFHDAHVRAVTLDTESETVTITFRLNAMNAAETETIQADAVLRWHDVEEVALAGWDGQNWLWRLEVVGEGGRVETQLQPSGGLGGTIKSGRLEVVSVQRIAPESEPVI